MLIFFRLVEFSRDIANACPIFNNFFVLTTHFDEKSPIEDFPVVASPDEIDGVYFHFEYHFERSRIVILNLDELKFRERFFHIFFSSIEVTLDQIERNVLNVIIEGFDLLDNLFPLGVAELLLLVIAVHNGHSRY